MGHRCAQAKIAYSVIGQGSHQRSANNSSGGVSPRSAALSNGTPPCAIKGKLNTASHGKYIAEGEPQACNFVWEFQEERCIHAKGIQRITSPTRSHSRSQRGPVLSPACTVSLRSASGFAFCPNLKDRLEGVAICSASAFTG